MSLKEEIQNITLYETPETDEAKELLAKNKKPFQIILISSIGIYIVLLAIFFHKLHIIYFISIALGLILFFTTILYFAIIPRYKKLLKIAKKNDLLRHEERIRFKERKRLEENYKPNINTKSQINDTYKLYKPQKPTINKGDKT